jgi:hypothetical protein
MQAQFIVSLPVDYARIVCDFIKAKFREAEPVIHDNLTSLPASYRLLTQPLIIITNMNHINRMGCAIQQPIAEYDWAGMIVLPDEEFITVRGEGENKIYFIMNPVIASHFLQSVIAIKQYNLPKPSLPQQSIYFIKQSNKQYIEDCQKN